MVRTRIAAFVAACALAGGTAVALIPSAGAQQLEAEADIVGITENVWQVAYVGSFECPGADPVVTSATVNGEAVPIVSQQALDSATVQLELEPDAPAGDATFVIECATIAPNPTEASDDYSSLALEKVVNGPVPEGAVFVVNVDCTGRPVAPLATEWQEETGVQQTDDPFSVDLEYGPEGGVGYVYTDFLRECVVTETENGGATTTTVDVPEDLYDAPINYFGTVTNTYAVVVTPTFTG